VKAHRVAYTLAVENPGGDCLMHTCDTPGCVRPDHLKPGTPRENALDAVTKGRVKPPTKRARGAEHYRARLTSADVRRIRAMADTHTQTEMAVMFGVAQRTVSNILTGITWKHLV